MLNPRWQRLHETLYPWLWAVITVLVMYRYRDTLVVRLEETHVSTAITVASILMGFLGTSYGILLSATTKRIEWAKGKTRIWGSILRFFNTSFIANFALCVYSLALSFFLNSASVRQYELWVFLTWLFLIVFAVVSFFRAMRVLLGLLKADD